MNKYFKNFGLFSDFFFFFNYRKVDILVFCTIFQTKKKKTFEGNSNQY